MYEFDCGSPVWRSHFRSRDKDELMKQVTDHVRTAHRIAPTASILGYLESTAVTEVSPTRAEA
jgi:predicted small metal-binding protein